MNPAIDLKTFLQDWSQNGAWGERRAPIRGQIVEIVLSPNGKSFQVILNRHTEFRQFGTVFPYLNMQKAKETAWNEVKPFLDALSEMMV